MIFEEYFNVLLGSAILAALTFGFMSCTSDDDDDDDEGAITKIDNDHFTISHTAGSSAYRAYKTSDQNHLGGIMQLTFNKDSLSDVAAMSYIWDLEGTTKDSDRAAKNPRRFCIAGFRTDGKVVHPYVSIYKNVVDIEEMNFGVNQEIKATENNKNENNEGKGYTATEDEVITLDNSASDANKFAVTPDSDGNVTVTIAVIPQDDSGNTTTSKATKFAIKYYGGAKTKEQIEATGANALTSYVNAEILAERLGYATNLKQQTVGVYANVKENSTLNGKWVYVKDYADADVVEE